MKKSEELLRKFGKLIEQGINNYKDLNSEIINICKSKRDEFLFKMRIAGKEDIDILRKRVESLEKELSRFKKKNQKGSKTVTFKPPKIDLSNSIFPPCDLTISEDIDKPKPTLLFVSDLPLSIL